MYSVYVRYLSTGREDRVNRTFETEADAVRHISMCLSIDKQNGQLGEYYYFIRKH